MECVNGSALASVPGTEYTAFVFQLSWLELKNIEGNALGHLVIMVPFWYERTVPCSSYSRL